MTYLNKCVTDSKKIIDEVVEAYISEEFSFDLSRLSNKDKRKFINYTIVYVLNSKFSMLFANDSTKVETFVK